jgi:dihydrofolate reductase
LQKEDVLRKLVATELITLDGAVQAPGGAQEDTDGGFVHGGAFEPMAAGECRLHVYPLVLGGGKRLFPEGKCVDLRLITSTPLPAGVLYQLCEQARVQKKVCCLSPLVGHLSADIEGRA